MGRGEGGEGGGEGRKEVSRRMGVRIIMLINGEEPKVLYIMHYS